MDAPHAATGEAQPEVAAMFEPPYFQWWNAQTITRDGKEVSCYEGWEASIEAVKNRMRQDGPFDGVLGFSQVLPTLPPPQSPVEVSPKGNAVVACNRVAPTTGKHVEDPKHRTQSDSASTAHRVLSAGHSRHNWASMIAIAPWSCRSGQYT